MVVDCEGSGLAVWTEELPLLALLEALPETAEGPMLAVSASMGMLNNYGPGVTAGRNPHAAAGRERPEE